MSTAPYTIIAPYGTVTDTREAAGDLFGEGLPLKSRGRVWDCPLTDGQVASLEAAGAEVYERTSAEGLRDVVGREGYELAPLEE